MITTELIKSIASGELDARFIRVYGTEESELQKARYTEAIKQFEKLYGVMDAELFSVAGRSEISGNHTDHNKGCVLAASVSVDVIAVAAKTDDGLIRIKSEGFDEDVCELSDIQQYKTGKQSSLPIIAGVCDGFEKRGLKTGAFCAYTTSTVLKGSGLSSSAAFEDMVGNILSHMFNGGSVSATEISVISQYAENEFFGKPCGLMDQVACAFGGFVFIDFKDEAPYIEPVAFDLSKYGYELCIVNTGGNHVDLTDDYASVPYEMKQVASYFGKSVLRQVDEKEFYDAVPQLRESFGDRATMRAMHFYGENKRVLAQKKALTDSDIETFLSLVDESGESSFKYLQNIYSNKDHREQGIALALALTENFLAGKSHASRVHGGGFAGTMLCMLKKEDTAEYKKCMDNVFGKNACTVLTVRKYGATKI